MRLHRPALVVVVSFLAAAVLGVGAAFPGAGKTGDASAAVEARGLYARDFINVLQLIADLRSDAPAQPLVCLLGGSSARESTLSDQSWSDDVSARRGYEVMAVNLGSKHRLFAQDWRLIGYLPEGTDIVFVGVNMGRFCNGWSDPPIVLPEPSLAGEETRAARESTRILPDWLKRHYAEEWMIKRWPYFRKRFRYNLGVLERVCRRSLARGQHPVIIDMPRDMQIIGDLLDRPLRRYHRGCRALAERLGIPYVQFQASTGLTNRDFSDLWHTVKSGQIKWQSKLSATTAMLLKKYDVGPAPSPSASPSPPASPEPTEEPSPSGLPSAAPR